MVGARLVVDAGSARPPHVLLTERGVAIRSMRSRQPDVAQIIPAFFSDLRAGPSCRRQAGLAQHLIL
jgi:hypothetical protein